MSEIRGFLNESLTRCLGEADWGDMASGMQCNLRSYTLMVIQISCFMPSGSGHQQDEPQINNMVEPIP